VPVTTQCYDLLPLVNINQDVLMWHIEFSVPRVQICTAAYSIGGEFMGVNIGLARAAAVAIMAVGVVWGIFKRG